MELYYNIIVMLAAALSVLGGAGYFWRLARVQRQARAAARASLGWPAVSGRIVQSKVVKDQGSGWYLPAVVYDYSVAGQTYRGTQIAFVVTHPGRQKKAQSIVDRYKAGSAVTVYHDPSVPERGVLERGRHGSWTGPWLSMLFAGFCVVIAVGLALAAIGMYLDRHAGVGH